MSRPERHQAIVLLLRTLTDYDYQPPTWTGSLRAKSANAGEGPTTTIICKRCDGEGSRRVRTVVQTCEDCGGRGVLVVDAYTGRAQRTMEQQGESHQRMVRCSSCGGTKRGPWWRNGDELTNTCRRCWGSGYEPAPSHPVRPWRDSLSQPLKAEAPELGRGDPVIACMERRQLAGSYEELGLALGALRLEYRPRYRLIVGVYVEAEREEDELHLDEAMHVEHGLGYIGGLMPPLIRVPSWASEFEKRRRAKVLEKRRRNGEEVAA